MRKAIVRKRTKTRLISGLESLEPRVLLASDIHSVGAAMEHIESHGPGCGCPGCSGIAACGGDISAVLPEGHWEGDGHDHGADSLRYDVFGNAYFFDPAPELGGTTDGGDSGGSGGGGEGLEELPILHSNPGAAKKIFLDFDGEIITGTAWNSNNNGNPIHAPAYDQDGNIFDFNNTEINRIIEIWERVAEDFAPFDVDVTTEDPGSAFFAAGGQGIRTMISTDRDDARLGGTGNFWFGGAGGVAYVNSWNWNSDTPVWVFENNLGGNAKNIAEAASHEVGHALGLTHDGVSGGASYYSGHGSGETGWAPIMGVGYNRNVTQWSRGDYNGANNGQNDLNIIRNKVNYRIDDHSNSTTNFAAATPVNVNGTSVSGEGIVEQQGDVDVFRFDITAGSDLTINVDPFNPGPNLDIVAELYDASGNLIATDNPTNQLEASITVSVPSGIYLLAIDGSGKGTWASNGYDDYGSLGQYFVSGTIEQTAVDTVAGGPVVVSAPTVDDLTSATSITYVFNQAINQASFDPFLDVPVFRDPLGSDLRSQITGYEFTDVDTLRIDFNPQTIGGTYDITIGPAILDIDGLQMDQDQDGNPGESTDDYVFSFDTVGDGTAGGPAVVSEPVVNDLTEASSITYVFNQAINQDSFDPLHDITLFKSPLNVDLKSEITGFEFTDVDTLRIDFNPQSIGGSYEITLGPEILDVEGLPMDQNQNGIAGETTDAYPFSFDLIGDGVLGGPVAVTQAVPDNPTNASSVTIQFNQDIDPASLSINDIGLFLSASSTDLRAEITGIGLAASDTVEISFNTQSAPGVYVLALGPDIRDLEGLAMDQNQNGISGEAGDLLQTFFQVVPSAVPGDFNGDAIVNAEDIDLLCAEVIAGTNAVDFDLTGDGSVDTADMDEMILNVVGTLYGDANLDFVVDASDFNLWNANKFTSGSGWAEGNFNCDTVVDASDFNIWNANKFNSVAGAAAGSVIPIPGMDLRAGDTAGDFSAIPRERFVAKPNTADRFGDSRSVERLLDGRRFESRRSVLERAPAARSVLAVRHVDDFWARLG